MPPIPIPPGPLISAALEPDDPLVTVLLALIKRIAGSPPALPVARIVPRLDTTPDVEPINTAPSPPCSSAPAALVTVPPDVRYTANPAEPTIVLEFATSPPGMRTPTPFALIRPVLLSVPAE